MRVRHSLDPRPMARIGGIFAVATALTIFLAAFVIGGSAPVDPNLAAVEIVKGAAGTHDATQLSAAVDDLGSAMFLVFVLIMGRLAEPEGGGLLSKAAALMTGTWLAVNVVWAGAEFAFADATVHNTDPIAAKALFLFAQSLLVVIAIPIALQYIALGLLIPRTRVLPVLIGWFAFLAAAIAIVAEVASIYSVLDFIGLVTFAVCAMLWPLVAGVVLIVRSTSSVAPALAESQSVADPASK